MKKRMFLMSLLAAQLALTSSGSAEVLGNVPDAAAEAQFGPEITTEEKLAELGFLAQYMRANYGPLQYKAKTLGVDLGSKVQEYQTKMQATKTNAEFYYLINKFVAEFQDSHFSSRVPSKLASILPFSTELVDGKVVIDEVVPSMAGFFRYTRGDEIVALDGKPIKTVLDEIGAYIGHGNPQTNRRISAFLVPLRPGRIMPVPHDALTLNIRRLGQQNVESVNMEWLTVGEALDEDLRQSVDKTFARVNSFDTISIAHEMAEFRHPKIERNYMCSGSTRIAIPADATIIMQEPFVAYYHPTSKGNVGYLRIPEYMATNPATGESEFVQRFRQYRYAIKILEENTVGLIIDQDHNCGGSVSYLHQLVSLLVTEKFKPVQFQLRANKTEYLDYRSYAEQEAEFTLDKQAVQAVANLLLNTWQKGLFLTPQTPIDGINEVYPDSVHYTKPIVILIDEMSGSGGDAFPSLMQGIGRAKLLGQRTMGAGGHVNAMPPLPISGININMTRSLFYRPDGVPVENNGASPDIPYTITMDDFMNGYRGYQQFYLSKLLEIIQ